ncbi:DUF732 domain-containing protein [Mycobacterium sp. NPDC003449]
MFTATPHAGADATAYLINVAVRPGYHFADTNAAIDYGNGICAKVRTGRPYSELLDDIKGDLVTDDGYQASYLIAQAANELCPQLIWTLRNSAAGYRSAHWSGSAKAATHDRKEPQRP